MGGMVLRLDKLTFYIWTWCLEKNNFLSASYLKGSDNYMADFYSRNFFGSSEWMLKKKIFQRICLEFFTPDIDLFASRINCQLKKYVSYFPSPDSFKNDAFSYEWTSYEPYLLPPISLIGKVVNKLVENKVQRAILIMPLWRSQFGFPFIMDLLISIPVRLPRHRELLTLPHDGTVHPLYDGRSAITRPRPSSKCCRNYLTIMERRYS